MTSSLLAYNGGDKLSHRKYSETAIIKRRPPSWNPDTRKSLSISVSELTLLTPTLRSSQRPYDMQFCLTCNFERHFEPEWIRCSKQPCYNGNIRCISSRRAQTKRSWVRKFSIVPK